MSYHAADDPDVPLPWFQKKRVWIIMAGALCLLAAGVGFFTYIGMKNIPDVGGGLTIAADPDTRIYIGDKFVGTTMVNIPWTQLLGNEKQEPLAIELPYPAGTITPELISGPGATILKRRNHATGHSPTMDDREDSYLLRRADGTLDHVVAYLIGFTSVNQPRSYLILVRARKGAAGSTTSFEHQGGSESHFSTPGFVKAFGKSPEEMEYMWRFAPYAPPDKFSAEVEKKGYWEPGQP
jgi:hypothetical protein